MTELPRDAWTLEHIYRAIRDGTPEAEEARCLLTLRHWFHEVTDFDDSTGAALPASLSEFCKHAAAAAVVAGTPCWKDRLHRVLEHIRQPLPTLMRHLNEGLVR